MLWFLRQCFFKCTAGFFTGVQTAIQANSYLAVFRYGRVLVFSVRVYNVKVETQHAHLDNSLAQLGIAVTTRVRVERDGFMRFIFQNILDQVGQYVFRADLDEY